MVGAVRGGWYRRCLSVLRCYLVVRLGLGWVWLGFGFRRGVEWVQAVFPRGSCLFLGGGDLWVISPGVCWRPVDPSCRCGGFGWAPWMLAGTLGSVLVLLVSSCFGRFWICCSVERSKWPKSSDLLSTYIRLVMLMPNAMKFNFQTYVVVFLVFKNYYL